MRPEDITSSLTKHYFIAVSILALLSTLTYFSLYMGIKTSETTAHIVNLSGQQRMLSQRIASFAQQYYLRMYTAQAAKSLLSYLTVSQKKKPPIEPIKYA
ncbi:MAG: type IV pili methyl-accepting chemotaxis transducer N-terminal domain-containing protein [Sulfuricurvum sp.]|nr:type IV pili methyl-accepting chemotaxis transducer N-terminal domain-containing protein [Sulfuricurvum sp.]